MLLLQKLTTSCHSKEFASSSGHIYIDVPCNAITNIFPATTGRGDSLRLTLMGYKSLNETGSWVAYSMSQKGRNAIGSCSVTLCDKLSGSIAISTRSAASEVPSQGHKSYLDVNNGLNHL